MFSMIYTAPGGVEVIEPAEIATPEPAYGEVRVRVVAAALNHLDLWTRRGLPGAPPSYPHIGGCDIAGVVDLVGDGVSEWRPGDRVVVNPTIACGRCEWCRRG